MTKIAKTAPAATAAPRNWIKGGRAVAETTIHSYAAASQKGRDYSLTLSVPSYAYQEPRTLRISVHHDTSYQEQSRAKIELWTPAGWTALADLHSNLVGSHYDEVVAYGVREIPAASFRKVEATLLNIAAGILGDIARADPPETNLAR